MLHVFKGELKTDKSWHPFGCCALQGSFTDIAKHLDSLYQDSRMTRDALETLVQNSIRQGICDRFGETAYRVNFCLDTDLKSQPRNAKSKWVTATTMQISRLGQKER